MKNMPKRYKLVSFFYKGSLYKHICTYLKKHFIVELAKKNYYKVYKDKNNNLQFAKLFFNFINYYKLYMCNKTLFKLDIES